MSDELYGTASSLGKIENVFDPRHGLQVPGVLQEVKSNSLDHVGQAHLGQVVTDFDAWEAIDRC
jgi:hypothetical protein